MTDTNESNEAIIRVDRRGRLRYTKEQKEAMLAACRDSGLSGPQFAALHGIKYPTLASWLQNAGGTMQRPNSITATNHPSSYLLKWGPEA
jgi:transposase-like protein